MSDGLAAPRIDAVFAGGPKTLQDDRGPWRSSIDKQPLTGPVEVTPRGIVGDKATQRFYGGPDAALCIHLADHYAFWRERYGIDLKPGAVGENLTISGLTEDNIFVGDIVRLGSVLAQVSGPRVPCANQARHVHRKDWVKLSIRENRTGLYMRILEPGTLQPGDQWLPVDRRNDTASIPAINDCMYLHFDPAFAERMLHMPALTAWWKQQAAGKLAEHKDFEANSLFAPSDSR